MASPRGRMAGVGACAGAALALLAVLQGALLAGSGAETREDEGLLLAGFGAACLGAAAFLLAASLAGPATWTRASPARWATFASWILLAAALAAVLATEPSTGPDGAARRVSPAGIAAFALLVLAPLSMAFAALRGLGRTAPGRMR